MSLIGRTVSHKTLGLGIIESLNNGIITVCFSNEKISRFKFPNAFVQGFLTATDVDLVKYVQQTLADMKCDLCGGKNLKTDKIDGKRLCQTCREIHTATCSLCGELYIRSSAQFVADYEYTHIKTQMCSACAARKSFRCLKCGHRYFNEHRASSTIRINEHALCKACFDVSDLPSTVYKNHRSGEYLSFVMDQGDVLYVLLGNDECYKHDSRPALIRLKLSNYEEITIEGQYCTECKQVQITRNTCSEYRRYHEAMRCKLFLKGLDDLDAESTHEEVIYEFRDRADESKLKRLGYSVSQSDSLTDTERQALLESIISTNQVSKGYVICQLKNLIRINGKKQANSVALKKWERDLEFVLKL